MIKDSSLNNRRKTVKWPNTDVEFLICYNLNSKKYFVFGRGMDVLIDRLSKKGINLSRDEIKEKLPEIGENLFPEAKQ